MTKLEPINQTQLFGLNNFLNDLVDLYEKNKLPNKILLSGQKGLGKSTLAYHLINYVLSKDEKYNYDLKNLSINPENNSFKTILNKSNINFTLIDIDPEKKFIDINQIRDLISNLNKSSFNQKPRFILIDNIELLNTNSINALLKTLEEPSTNIYFILINNNKKILSTLLSRCINFKIFLSHLESMNVTNNLLKIKLNSKINKDFINHYSTPGSIYNLYIFCESQKFDLLNSNLKEFLEFVITNNFYKKDHTLRDLIYNFVEYYFTKINLSSDIYNKYIYFIKKISDTKKFNLDEETLFIEFREEILNG
tara:strand:+ start:175 stop:1101 length:927 start_codon:yes stop_codon:yes gene_type:complete